MISNFLKIAIRNLLRHKTYILINISGLAIGLACSIMIILFVAYELSYDRFNEKKDNIYRLILNGKFGDAELNGAYTAAPTAAAFLEDFPEVIDAARLDRWAEVVIKYDDKSFVEKDMILVDSSFFNIFSFDLIQGNENDVLNAPYKLVLTESTAKRYFGDRDPVGKQLRINSDTTYYTITGILKDPPENCHFNFTMAGSFLSHSRALDDFWLSNSFNTYILLEDGTSADKLETKIPALLEKYVGPQLKKFLGISTKEFTEAGNQYGLYLQPLTDIHLNNEIDHSLKPTNDKKYIYIFSVIAVLVIVIAAINYMNLSTARSAGRSKEVGIRKVVGSSKGNLVRQFLFESVIMSFLALIIAVLLVELTMPYFNDLINMHLSLNYFGKWYIVPGLIILSLIVGVLAGSYQAFYLSSFRPVTVLSGKVKSGLKNGNFRSFLVVIQFAISIIIILGTLIIYQQISYMQNKDLGFNKERLMAIRRAGALGDKTETFKQEIARYPGVTQASISTAVPGHPNNNNGYMIEGRGADHTILMNTTWIDYEHLETYKFQLDEGRFFSREFASDSSAIVINETAVRKFNLKDPIGTRFMQPADEPNTFNYLTVIGVVKDFHFQSLHNEIQPHVFILRPGDWHWGSVTVRLAPRDMNRAINNIENTWKKHTLNEPMQYYFVDEDFNSLYQQEKRNSKVALGFSVFSIFIATLGLFGLTAFTTEQRTREIGIRKVLGASGKNVVFMLMKEILILISISTIIAWIVSWFVMQNWLQNFYYRISLQPAPFFYAFLSALVIALLTILHRSLKASKTNPAMAIKYE